MTPHRKLLGHDDLREASRDVILILREHARLASEVRRGASIGSGGLDPTDAKRPRRKAS